MAQRLRSHLSGQTCLVGLCVAGEPEGACLFSQTASCNANRPMQEEAAATAPTGSAPAKEFADLSSSSLPAHPSLVRGEGKGQHLC